MSGFSEKEILEYFNKFELQELENRAVKAGGPKDAFTGVLNRIRLQNELIDKATLAIEKLVNTKEKEEIMELVQELIIQKQELIIQKKFNIQILVRLKEILENEKQGTEVGDQDSKVEKN